MQTVDTLSLTNRLKRSGICCADVAHLSCSTVAGILADVGKQLCNASVQDEELCAGRRNFHRYFFKLRTKRMRLRKERHERAHLEILDNFTYETLQMRSYVDYR
ncbi:hypothetical protein K438DRAFT_1868962 [Mycena galopus ATCC 62051]|nr:hypothetical protein K438DRAFT_1868962 [Mycena galopus ATCC 62051]